jgi:hypothetical protein
VEAGIVGKANSRLHRHKTDRRWNLPVSFGVRISTIKRTHSVGAFFFVGTNKLNELGAKKVPCGAPIDKCV